MASPGQLYAQALGRPFRAASLGAAIRYRTRKVLFLAGTELHFSSRFGSMIISLEKVLVKKYIIQLQYKLNCSETSIMRLL